MKTETLTKISKRLIHCSLDCANEKELGEAKLFIKLAKNYDKKNFKKNLNEVLNERK